MHLGDVNTLGNSGVWLFYGGIVQLVTLFLVGLDVSFTTGSPGALNGALYVGQWDVGTHDGAVPLSLKL